MSENHSAAKSLFEQIAAIAETDERTERASAVVTKTDADGTVWVRIAGSDSDTPCSRSSAAVSPGDSVSVRISGGRAVIEANYTRPATDDSAANEAKRDASSAAQVANESRKMAESAIADAQAAHGAAEAAAQSAVEAAASAGSAATSASSAATSASNAESSASDAASQATAAAGSASQAASQATAAATSASQAAGSASQAASSAAQANTYARGALNSLSDVENVVGTLLWIQQHGTYLITSDMQVDASKLYYTLSGGTYQLTTDTSVSQYKQYYASDGQGGYTPVRTPVAADLGTYYERLRPTATKVLEPTEEGLPGYYELYVGESVQNYIASHIAQTDYGLDVMPDGTSERVHIGTFDGTMPPGVYIVSGGIAQSAYTSSGVTVGAESGFHISISGTELGFYQGATRVAYISNNELHIPRAVVVDSMRIGRWSWRQRDNGNMGVFYVGGAA